MNTSKKRTLGALVLVLAVVAAARAVHAHCQIPCGIFEDQMRIHMLREDLVTVEKSMKRIVELSAAEKPDWNQIVRWVVNKEDHAKKIQEIVADYFLAQRIKVPADDADGAAVAKYHAQLSLLHRLNLAAAKMRQTTDVANVEAGRKLVDEFAATYFSPEDLKHLEEHK